MNLINAILDLILGRRYYANIVRLQGEDRKELYPFIFTNEQKAREHSGLYNDAGYIYYETISFRAKKIKRK